MPEIIGLTGGIGSGKSTVGKVFYELGIPVYNADTEANKLINSSPEIIRKLKKTFGEDIYDKKNNLERKKLANIIFNDKKMLNKVNSIVHPAVKKDFLKWVSEQTSKYVIKEAAILFESGSYKEVDKIITVIAPKNIKILRVCKRDCVSIEKVEERIKNQMPDNLKVLKSNYVIYNDEIRLVLPQIIKIHNKIINE